MLCGMNPSIEILGWPQIFSSQCGGICCPISQGLSRHPLYVLGSDGQLLLLRDHASCRSLPPPLLVSLSVPQDGYTWYLEPSGFSPRRGPSMNRDLFFLCWRGKSLLILHICVYYGNNPSIQALGILEGSREWLALGLSPARRCGSPALFGNA